MFGPTDHDHLGKLITYSAGLDAGVAVLVAEEFRDEHRSALDWLNHISQNDFAFFGIILEAWRIGDSNPAPRLRVDTQPDGWSRAVRAATSGESPTAQAYRRFWRLFLPRLHEAKKARPNWSRVSTPSKRHWMSFGSARSELLRYNPFLPRAQKGMPDRSVSRLDTRGSLPSLRLAQRTTRRHRFSSRSTSRMGPS